LLEQYITAFSGITNKNKRYIPKYFSLLFYLKSISSDKSAEKQNLLNDAKSYDLLFINNLIEKKYNNLESNTLTHILYIVLDDLTIDKLVPPSLKKPAIK